MTTISEAQEFLRAIKDLSPRQKRVLLRSMRDHLAGRADIMDEAYQAKVKAELDKG